MKYVLRKKILNLTILFFKSVLLLVCINLVECLELTEDTLFINTTDIQGTFNCTIKPDLENTIMALERKINQNNRLIRLNIEIQWNQSSQNSYFQSSLDWFLTTTRAGKHLLMLPENFTVKSLTTLSFGIAEVHLILKQEPEDCLVNVSADAASILLNYELLTLVSNFDLIDTEVERTFRTCNGSVETGGFCCKLTLTGDQIDCKALEDELLSIWLRMIFVILAVFFLSQSVSYIPNYFLKESKSHEFRFDSLTLNMKVRMQNSENASINLSTWANVSFVDHTVLSNFREKLRYLLGPDFHVLSNETWSIRINSISGSVREHLLQSEVSSPFGILQFLYNFLKQEPLNEGRMKRKPENLCSACKNLVFNNNELLVAFLINLFFVPAIFLRLIIVVQDIYMIMILGVLCFFLQLFISNALYVLLWKAVPHFFKELGHEEIIDVTTIIKSSLRETFEQKSGKNIPLLVRIFHQTLNYFPLFKFEYILILNIRECYKGYRKGIRQVLFLIFLITLVLSFIALFILFVLDILFYLECLCCTILGVALNYDYVFHYVTLLLIFITFIYDSVMDIQKKINEFTRNVFNTIRRIGNRTDASEKNQFILQSDVGHSFARFAFCEDGDIHLLLNGIAVFENIIHPEDINVKHVFKKYINQVASLPGHLTPGSKKTLLLTKFKELVILVVLLSFMVFLLSAFNDEKDVSGNVKTLITLITGAGTVILAKLWFENKRLYDGNNDVYFKALLMNHLASYEEQLIGEEFNYNITVLRGNEGIIEGENVVEAEINAGDINGVGLIVENINTNEETWYVRSLVMGQSFVNVVDEENKEDESGLV